LNSKGFFNIIIKGKTEEKIIVNNVRGVHASDKEKVANELATADIAATSVGNNALINIMPLLAQGLKKRYEKNSSLPLDIIIAENMRNVSQYFKKELTVLLGIGYPMEELLGLIETSIGKMVPIMSKKDMEEDILQIFAEPYNDLILDSKAFKNPIPNVKGLCPKNNIKAWVDRKLFVHNLGHAAVSYIGYLHNRDFVYLYEALSVKEIFNRVRNAMKQSAEILIKHYPNEFLKKDLDEHINDLLERFSNVSLGDTIYRVGMDLLRKLSGQDRLAGAIMLGLEHGMAIDNILHVLVCGCYFRATGESGQMFERDREFVKKYFSKGLEYVLINVCSFDKIKHENIISQALKEEINIKKLYEIA
ncbi:MAG: mannitol-1-phosphate 5-dehydrogenase, partial [Actinobacteria bacterium]|nr:mannitol-1-phosphate 5-dehydrogenase [Actinomycetota bacterium]